MFTIYAYGVQPHKWGNINENLKGDKALPNSEQVELCKAWLRRYAKRPAKATDKNGYSSYWLKHRVEAAGDLTTYVSNGAFIKAAVDLGFEVYRKDPYNINVWIHVNLKREVLKHSRCSQILAIVK